MMLFRMRRWKYSWVGKREYNRYL